jgi:hypothetical protein
MERPPDAVRAARAQLKEAGPIMGAGAVKRVPLALACVALSILAGIGQPTARAQAYLPSSGDSTATTTGAPGPEPVIVPSGGRAFASETPPTRIALGPLDVIRESLFGAASEEAWRPLGLATFFTEGWDEPYVKSPPGTNGAPKQNWFGAADAIFTRLSSLNLFYTNGMTTHTGLLLSPFPGSPVKPQANGNQWRATTNGCVRVTTTSRCGRGRQGAAKKSARCRSGAPPDD